jgi:hypothetical protein
MSTVRPGRDMLKHNLHGQRVERRTESSSARPFRLLDNQLRLFDNLDVFGSRPLGAFTDLVLDGLPNTEGLDGRALQSRVMEEDIASVSLDESKASVGHHFFNRSLRHFRYSQKTKPKNQTRPKTSLHELTQRSFGRNTTGYRNSHDRRFTFSVRMLTIEPQADKRANSATEIGSSSLVPSPHMLPKGSRSPWQCKGVDSP